PGCAPPKDPPELPRAFHGAMATDCKTALVGDVGRDLEVIRRGKVHIVVDHGERRIILAGAQEFFGGGASNLYAARATQMIRGAWSGPVERDGERWELDAAITGRARDDKDPWNPASIAVEVVLTADPVWVTADKDPAHQA